MGYLSQVVQDARPRAAPSLYAQTAVAPAGAADPVHYARLMESHPAQAPEHNAPEQSVHAQESMQEADEETASDPTRRPPSMSQPTSTSANVQPDVIHPTTRGAAPVPTASDLPPVTGPIDTSSPEQPVRRENATASGVTPRPTSFEVTQQPNPHAPTTSGSTPGKQRGSVQHRTSESQAQTVSASPTEVISPRVSRAGNAPTTPDSEPPAAARPNSDQPLTVANVTPIPQTTPQIAPPQPAATAPTEVRIGEVEIIVQDPPAQRSAPAPRAANAAPSPARYHIRRF